MSEVRHKAGHGCSGLYRLIYGMQTGNDPCLIYTLILKFFVPKDTGNKKYYPKISYS